MKFVSTRLFVGEAYAHCITRLHLMLKGDVGGRAVIRMVVTILFV
jgi:hypothetical protein